MCANHGQPHYPVRLHYTHEPFDLRSSLRVLLACSPDPRRTNLQMGERSDDGLLTHALSVRYATQLARFFPDPGDVLAFRQLQTELQSLVSGSHALQLLDRTVYQDSDLDLYV